MPESEDVYAGGGGLVPHPALRALGWVKDWILWSLFAAVLWESLAVGPSTKSLSSVIARAAAIIVALVYLGIALDLLHTWLTQRREATARYAGSAPFQQIAIVVLTLILVAVGGFLCWIVHRVVQWLRPSLSRLLERIPPHEVPVLSMPIWVGIVLLAAGGVIAYGLLAPLWPKHRRVWRVLGPRRALRGYGLMAILRLRQPRKDFFAQAPVVGQMMPFAFAAAIHAVVPLGFVAWTVPFLVVAASLGNGIDLLLPPAWLFLGRSHHDSFRTFDMLRHGWPVFGVTLLDRDSAEWSAYYFAMAERMRRHSFFAGFMNNPRTPRVWSLRSRGRLWESTVAHLMRLAPVIVVDVRAKSYWVFDEVLWLAELEWIDKAWLLGEADASAPALEGALEWARKDQVSLPEGSAARLWARVVTEEQLCNRSSWTPAGLHIDRTPASAGPATATSG